MIITVNPDWWQTIFDETYLVTDARSVCNEEVTRREVDLFCELVPISPEHRILDLCGGHGRHSLELYRRGYAGCTVFDYSAALLKVGSRDASRLGYSISFVQGDARHTELEEGGYNGVFILGNSLGYISDPSADLQILRESFRLLAPRGWLLIDVADAAVVRHNFTPCSWHEIGDDVIVCRQRELRANAVWAREIVLSKEKGLIRDQTYGIRLYDPDSLSSLVEQAGFSQVSVHTDFAPNPKAGDLGFMNQRMVVTALKK